MPMEEASEFQFPLEVVEAAKSLAQSFRNIKPKDGLFGLALVSTAVGGWFFFRHVMRAPTHSELAQRIREESRRRPMVVGSKCKGDVKVLLKLDALEAAEVISHISVSLPHLLVLHPTARRQYLHIHGQSQEGAKTFIWHSI